MMKSILASAGLVAAATAFTQPTSQTFGSLLTPDVNTPVTTGQTYTVTWVPSAVAGQTISLVLCNGPGANCVLQSSAIVEGVPASQGSYAWSVPCGMSAGVQSTETGYGMLIIVDGTGEFQYSTQFSVETGASCGTTSSSTTSSVITTSSSVITIASSVSSSLTTALSPNLPSGGISGRPAGYTDTTGGWYGWSATANSTMATVTASSKISSAPVVTSKPVEATTSATKTSVYASTYAAPTTATPSAFTGSAAAQAVNFFALIGAVGLAVLLL